MYVKIPLSAKQHSSRSFSLTLGGGKNARLTLVLHYLDLYDLWLADIVYAPTGETLAAGVPLVPGVNILEQYAYLGLGEAYIVKAEPTKLQHPDKDTLGTTFIFVWGDNSE